MHEKIESRTTHTLEHLNDELEHRRTEVTVLKKVRSLGRDETPTSQEKASIVQRLRDQLS